MKKSRWFLMSLNGGDRKMNTKTYLVRGPAGFPDALDTELKDRRDSKTVRNGYIVLPSLLVDVQQLVDQSKSLRSKTCPGKLNCQASSLLMFDQ